MSKSSNCRILHALALTVMTGSAGLRAAAALCPGTEPTVTLSKNSRKTGAVSSAPPKCLASYFRVWRRASAPFALLRTLDSPDVVGDFDHFAVDRKRNHAQQAGSTLPAPSARIEVHAPFAQQLIVKIKAEHPEIQKLGLHAVPSGQTRSAIIANNYPEKIGKLSTPGDLKTVASGEPKAHRIDKGKFWDAFIPLHDEHGKVIGLLVMEVPFNTAPTEEGAIAEGIEITDEVQRQVPTLGKLFEPAK